MANQPSVSDVRGKAQDTGSKAAEGARDLGHQAADKARDLGQQAADKARDVASSAAQTARSALGAAGQQAENLTDRAGSSVKSLADTVRQHGPREGYLGSATETVASGLERTGDYLQEQGLSGMGDDVTRLIRNNPIPAMFAGIAFGFLLARVLRS